MFCLLVVLTLVPFVTTQFPAFGRGGRFNSGGNFGRGFAGESSFGGSERGYYVRGRLLCGPQGLAGVRVSIWENRGDNSPYVYEEIMTEDSGSFYVRAESRNTGGFNSGGSAGQLILTINHNCEGRRQMSFELPQSYYNYGGAITRTFDIGTINLEARYSGEESNSFSGGNLGDGRRDNFRTRTGNNNGGFGGVPTEV
ncbi:Transthyretin-like family protein [Oesophagostomum dentatum]|uniref:Transthyretin-like family protein n=1 Tax=Oesophagostomum dentatum TaxID=61180 RepID=A0A0B1S646_OESDE|nr:Transthyretin-like family protein [Oesophagostomum dentatum]